MRVSAVLIQFVPGFQRCGSSILDSAHRLRRQSREDVLQIRVRVVSVEPCRLDQTYDHCGLLTRTQAAGKQPVQAPHGHRPNLVLDPIVLCRQSTIIDIARQRKFERLTLLCAQILRRPLKNSLCKRFARVIYRSAFGRFPSVAGTEQAATRRAKPTPNTPQYQSAPETQEIEH